MGVVHQHLYKKAPLRRGFLLVDVDTLYPFKSRGFGGEIGVNYLELWNSDFVYGGTNDG